ncbi:MAG: HNH endonuclease [Gemmatimonadales bacterium]|nr:HNH endonuclease [Gemmatimonadales bacterium]
MLARHPLCVDCFAHGRVVTATDVDHDDGDPSNNDASNLISRCHSCHSTKTMRERLGLPRVYGCDVAGMPLDPDHPWNREQKNHQQPSGKDRAPSLPSSLTGKP